MALPYIQTPDRVLSQIQTQWQAQLNPVLANPLNSASMLKGIKLVTGVNVINHLLGQQQQGWIITDINAAITVFRSQPFNDLTLTLTASGPATINLAVY